MRSLRSITRIAALVLGAGTLIAPIAAAPTVTAAPAPIVGLYGSNDPTYDGVYRQSLAILALRAAGRTPAPEAVEWLLNQQCADGSFSSYKSGATCAPYDPMSYSGGPDSNATALAAQALIAVGSPGAVYAANKAVEYLVSVQFKDGGWEYTPGGTGNSDPNSTGLVLLALNAADVSPTTPVTAYYQAAQIGWTDFATHAPASDLGGIASPFSSGAPDAFATVQSIPGVFGASLVGLKGTSSAWQDGATTFTELPSADNEGVADWASTWLAAAVSAAGPSAYAQAHATNAAWAVLSFAADHTNETLARELEAALVALPTTTDPGTNGQYALAAAAVGDTAAVNAFDDRIVASLTPDTSAPSSDWKVSPSIAYAGESVRLTRLSLSDPFWLTSDLQVHVVWGDGTDDYIGPDAKSWVHTYWKPGFFYPTIEVKNPTGLYGFAYLGPVTVDADVYAPTVKVLTPKKPTQATSWTHISLNANDVGSGVKTVLVRVAQQRHGSWLSWDGKKWEIGLACWVPASRVGHTGAWTVNDGGLKAGPMIVSAIAQDNAGLASAAVSVKRTLK